MAKVEAPVTPKVELRVVAPVTPRIPPRVVAPVPTMKVFEPVTEVAPLRLMLPVPVEIVPVPDWVIEPLVLTLPFSSTVKLGVPFDCKERRVLLAELVSLITRAVAVPWLVMLKLESVAVSAKVNEMFLLSVVVIVLPPVYAL